MLRFHDAEGPRFYLLLGARFGQPLLIGPDLQTRVCAVEELRAHIVAPYEARHRRAIERVLDVAGVAGARRRAAAGFMAQERLKGVAIVGCLMLRMPASAGFGAQLRRRAVGVRLGAMAAVFALVYALEILSWSVMGGAAMNGRFDFGWLGAWILLVLSIAPLRLAAGWIGASAAIDVGRILKSRLLAGGLRTDIESLRRVGAGRLLARVMESQAFEALAISGGMAALVAIIELAFAFWLLSLGAGGALHVGLLVAWLALGVGLGMRYVRGLADWTKQRGDMTHGLIERMIGRRTVLAQEDPRRRDAHQDAGLKDYLTASRGLDRAMMPVFVGMPAGWTILGLAGLAPAFVTGSANATQLAIGVGAVLFAGRALMGVAGGIATGARAAVAWREIAPLFAAASHTPAARPFTPSRRPQGGADEPAPKLVDAHGLVFAYAGRRDPVLRDARLTIARGERLLLEGGSGGGKSTLAALLTGLRTPQSGLILLDGLDRATLGESWRDLVTKAPQFHENHILGGTLAFNLLMGRAWPASEDDLAEAREVCEELGLGGLLARMPGGLMQMVGETGWQLSHGERSRIYLARALLQGAPLTILDESFAALDPQTLELCLACAFRRADALLVIAHP